MKNLLILMPLTLGGCLDPGEPGILVPKAVTEDPSLPRIALVDARMFELAEEQGMDFTTHHKELQPKVLLLRGSLFTANRLEHRQEMVSRHAYAEVVTMPNVGNEMIWEGPAEHLEHTRAYFVEISFEGGAS